MPFKSFLFLIFFSLSCFAQPYSDDRALFEGGIGPAVLLKSNYRKNNTASNADKDPVVLPIPTMSFRMGPFSIVGPSFQVHFYRSPFFSFAGILRWAGDRYKADGMDPRRGSIFAGGSLRFMMFRFSMVSDTMGRSNGKIFQWSVSHRFALGENYFLIPNLFLELWDRPYVHYFFGVQEHEATTDRPAYQGTYAFNPGLSLMNIWKINEDWTFSNRLSGKYLGSSVRHSPTVNRQWAFALLLSLSYKF